MFKLGDTVSWIDNRGRCHTGEIVRLLHSCIMVLEPNEWVATAVRREAALKVVECEVSNGDKQ